MLLDLNPENKNHRRLEHDTTSTAKSLQQQQIPRLSCNELSYSDFYWNHMQKNWPVVITKVSTNWECHLNWTLKSKCRNNNNNDNADIQRGSDQLQQQTTAINYDYLRQKVGNCHVPVANCSKEYFNSHEKCEMCFFDYLDYWQRQSKQNCSTETDNVIENSNFVKPTDKHIENLYLKDWHLKAQIPDYDFYTVPKYFASDWLNEYLLDNEKDDYRFVYMGPKNSWTPFHADVFGSYSWSTNIVGCKRWILLPPGEENALKDNFGNLPFRIDEKQLMERNLRYFIIQQTENEAIFVPSGWYHQVHNISDTISVNHNWFNACNLQQIWQNLAYSMQQVVAEIDDCRQMDNFEEHCHTMLRASFGINIYDFLNILEHIAEKRLKLYAIKNNNNHMADDGLASISIDDKIIERKQYLLFDTFTLNDFHIRQDLEIINAVVQEMLNHSLICDKRAVLQSRCLCLEELTRDYHKNILK